MTATTWNQLRDSVGMWSVANFGTQFGLGCLAPLLGIIEESTLELYDADGLTDRIDAYADVLIYLMDFCYRSGIDIDESDVVAYECGDDVIDRAVGRLARTMLKRIQRIRGFENDSFFNSELSKSVHSLIRAVHMKLTDNTSYTAFSAACEIFDETVSKRKWHEMPQVLFNEHQYTQDFLSICHELHRGVSQQMKYRIH